MEFFDKTKGIKTLTAKFDYVKNHFQYDVMNSWNCWTTIANNVKIYNLHFTRYEEDEFWSIYGDENLANEFYNLINLKLRDFENNNKDFKLYFNGRSDGYLVLKGDKYFDEKLSDICSCENYKELLDDYKGYYDFKTAQDITKDCINYIFECVKSFDEFCDDLLNYVKGILNNSTITEEERTETIKYKTLNY